MRFVTLPCLPSPPPTRPRTPTRRPLFQYVALLVAAAAAAAALHCSPSSRLSRAVTLWILPRARCPPPPRAPPDCRLPLPPPDCPRPCPPPPRRPRHTLRATTRAPRPQTPPPPPPPAPLLRRASSATSPAPDPDTRAVRRRSRDTTLRRRHVAVATECSPLRRPVYVALPVALRFRPHLVLHLHPLTLPVLLLLHLLLLRR
mmetsp:Transcript_4639/g.11496  ORF Transcript_4639/g.11496 Transcript_4639/m.11496 type:complete len:202 (-) Transcript_4639:2009-2614(-)